MDIEIEKEALAKAKIGETLAGRAQEIGYALQPEDFHISVNSTGLRIHGNPWKSGPVDEKNPNIEIANKIAAGYMRDIGNYVNRLGKSFMKDETGLNFQPDCLYSRSIDELMTVIDAVAQGKSERDLVHHRPLDKSASHEKK